ncbi:TrmB family transcriptional regulator [Thermococcus sp. GR7]|uniref:HTH-type sugar sensing transcriptional regulator TrmBL1 n=1 Tax=unclassified Thermococcus TaxID=2627626 RepID=UPI00142FE35F|nr:MULTISPECIES: TrmB family transcriptional regulator [unclassified Thermococcus]NJE45969.1 TrmB family transcriptional regulator [Thermococcus sp. GR7]NJE78462.1 TrmB family transcriptional regulator [Thermococcus sp. GR4]NJF22165.1 TrmB family transcriptional regulator [Thermococcus sp. GR5]
MKEEEIIEKLQKLGLTKYESLAYITLLKLGPSKATDITKESGIPHTRVYDVLSSLHRKGFVDVMHGAPRLYKPVNPEVVLEKIKEEFIEDLENLKAAFLELYRQVHGEGLPEIWTIQGFENTVERAEYVIRTAKHEVLINAPFEFLRLLKDEIKRRKDIIFVIISNFEEIPEWLNADNIILAKTGGAPWLMASWIIGDIDYALFFGALPRDKRREKFYSFWAKSPKIIQNYMHWFYTIYLDNSEIIKPLNYDKLPKPLSFVNIRTLITVLKFTELPRRAEVIGRLVETKEPVTLDGEIVEYEYTPLMANVTVKASGKEWKVGGIGSYFEDVEGEKFILLE